MKTIIRLLLFLPLVWLSGCYTQFALHSRHTQEYTYEDEVNYDDADSSAYAYDDSTYYDYYNDYNTGYRRFLFGYYPSSMYLGVTSDLFPWWGSYYPYRSWYWDYDYISSGYYYPWGYYGPHVYNGYPWYYNGSGGYGNGYDHGKYRGYVKSRSRDNDFERGGRGTPFRDYGSGTRSSSIRRERGDRGLDVDLQKARVGSRNSGSSSSSSGDRLNKTGANNSSGNTSEIRSRSRSENSGNTSGSRESRSGRSEVRSERSQPVYVPRSERSYNSSPSSSPRSESPSRGSGGGDSRSSGGGDSRSSGGSSSGGSRSGGGERTR